MTLKRGVDVVVSGVLLLLAAPAIVVCAAVVCLDAGRPWLFTQVRSGLNGRPFTIFKLRTLRSDVGPPSELGQVVSESPCVTRSGRLLRRWKLDELPQLWNVLRGDMSLVGPRPTLPEQVQAYSPLQRRRLGASPGLTGCAQVSGGTLLSWDDRILLDIYYVDHRSFRMDLSILARTFRVLVGGERRDRATLQRAQLHVATQYRAWCCRSGHATIVPSLEAEAGPPLTHRGTAAEVGPVDR